MNFRNSISLTFRVRFFNLYPGFSFSVNSELSSEYRYFRYTENEKIKSKSNEVRLMLDTFFAEPAKSVAAPVLRQRIESLAYLNLSLCQQTLFFRVKRLSCLSWLLTKNHFAHLAKSHAIVY